jgi:hypothetical protein
MQNGKVHILLADFSQLDKVRVGDCRQLVSSGHAVADHENLETELEILPILAVNVTHFLKRDQKPVNVAPAEPRDLSQLHGTHELPFRN